MTCPDCHRRTEVVKTLQIGESTHRERRCECGTNFTTTETIVATGNRRQPRVTKELGQATTRGAPQPPVTPGNAGGVGGGLPSGSDQGPDSGPISVADPIRGRGRARSTPPANYPTAFEVEWNLTAKTGSKFDAFRAWEKLGKPSFGGAWIKWLNCAEWREEWFHYPHVSSWLNDGRYQQDPAEAKPKVTRANPKAAAADREEEERQITRLFGVGQ